MKIINPSIEFLWSTDDPLKKIELAGRTCYKSEANITEDSSKKFVATLISRGHEAMIEHASMSYRIICDRGVTHELVRHRLFSFAQESTRYVNYNNKEMEFITPIYWKKEKYYESDKETKMFFSWMDAMVKAEEIYKEMIDEGATPQEARSVLPNSLKTEIVVTGNMRQWRLFFKLRTHKTAHPQMIEVAEKLLTDAKSRVPIIFDDLGEENV